MARWIQGYLLCSQIQPLGKINLSGLYRVEACVVSFSQAIQAQRKGADRIEICSHLATGGITPDLKLVIELVQKLDIPVRVMIRNTEVGFEADELILEKMVQSIEEFKSLPIDGFVTGVMKNNRIDKEAMKRIIIHSNPLPITFHKAIDGSDDINEDVLWINEFPALDTILTSGGAEKASDGIGKILEIKSLFSGSVMACGKIRPHQLDSLHEHLGLEWYHGRGIVGELGD